MLLESIRAATGNQTLVMTGMSDSFIWYDQLGFLGQDSNILGRLKARREDCVMHKHASKTSQAMVFSRASAFPVATFFHEGWDVSWYLQQGDHLKVLSV